MWLFTKYGMFSAVRESSKEEKGNMLIRSRKKQWLLWLMKAFPEIDTDVIENGGTDYKYRIILDNATYEQVFSALVTEVDYTNFKGKVAGFNPDKQYAKMLHDVWDLGWDVQSKEEKVTKKK